MLFNSIEYLLFFTVVFFVFWFLLRDNVKLQNIFLLAANYFFYGWWDWRFLTLIIFISALNYFTAIQIGKYDPVLEKQKRKLFLIYSLVINLGLLAVFKYFNFFAQSAADLVNTFGLRADALTLNIILPIGISFYTFQTMSYTLDVYGTKIKPTRDIISFFAYVSFFPLILAGPIERAGNLLTQFIKKREFNYDEATDGMRQILWGLFKKVVIADRAAIYVDAVFSNVEQHSGITFVVATLFFAFQIYCDFSGYSDIAIGSARLLGFRLMTNFNIPYFSKDIAEFWKRWHISLSTWLRDYLYLPIAYSLTRKLTNKKYFAIRSDKLIYFLSTTVTFLICGFWHGANWTFVFWGFIHGSFLVLSLVTKKIRKNISNYFFSNRFFSIQKAWKLVITFIMISFSWIFFRSNSMSDAVTILKKIFTLSGSLYIPQDDDIIVPFYALIGIIILIAAEIKIEFYAGKFPLMHNKNIIIRYAAYSFIIIAIMLMGVFDGGQFIYFQF